MDINIKEAIELIEQLKKEYPTDDSAFGYEEEDDYVSSYNEAINDVVGLLTLFEILKR